MRRAGFSGAMRVRILAAPTPPDKTRRAPSSISSRRPAFGFSPGPWQEKHRSERIGRISLEKSTGGAASSGKPISPQKSNVRKRIQANHSASPKCNTCTVRPTLALALLATVGAARAATVDPLLKDFRIALRMGPDRVLLIGGELQGYLESEEVRTVIEDFPADLTAIRQRPRVAPVDDMHFASPERLAKFHFAPETLWKPGDRWQLHPGATPSVGLILEQIGFGFYCGGPGGWAIAVARYESPAKARLVAGLRAEAYLATPGSARVHVSQVPMLPLRTGPMHAAVSALLLKNSRAIIRRSSDQDLQRAFLGSTLSPGKLTAFRWVPPRGRAFIFASERWFDDGGRDLIEAGGVLVEGSSLAIIQAGAVRAEREDMSEPFGFLNVWQIGGRNFVLTYSRGQESYEVSLDEIVPGKGLAESGLSCMEGC